MLDHNKSNLKAELIEFSQCLFSKEENSDCELVELQGCTVHRSPVRTVFVYLCCIGAGALATMKWPLLGAALVLACIWGTYRETRGLRGFIGEFLTREIGMNLIFWRGARLPESDSWTPPNKRKLVLVFPRNRAHALNPMVLWILIAGIVIFVAMSWMKMSIIWPALCCVIIGGLGILVTSEHPPPSLNSSLETPLGIVLSAPRNEHLDIVAAVIDQGIFNCGLTTFLQSYKRFLNTDNTALIICKQRTNEPTVVLGNLWSKNPEFQMLFPIGSLFPKSDLEAESKPSLSAAEYLGWNTALIAADWSNAETLNILLEQIPRTPLLSPSAEQAAEEISALETEQDVIEQ